MTSTETNEQPEGAFALRLAISRISSPASVVRREFAQETVVLNLDTGMYHGLNPTAASMLEALEATGSFEESVRLVADRHEAPPEAVRHDLADFCERLLERGLLEVNPA